MMVQYELLKAIPVAIYTTDADGRITFYNEAAAAFWGQHPQAGARWCGSWRLYHSDGRPMSHDQCAMAQTILHERALHGEEAMLERADGTRAPFQAFPTPLFHATGELTGAINMLVDLTERRNSAADSERLAAIVASSDDAIISKTLQGEITSWNASATRIFGYDSEEMIGQSIMKLIPPELRDEEKMIIAKLVRGERVDHFETVRVTKDGRPVDISLTVSPLRDATGRVVGASKVARDISERRRAEEVQRLLFDELHHRVKNTLATVQAMASQTLRRSTTPDAFVSSFNGRIRALARAHALLAGGSLQCAEIADLVREQLMLGGAEDRRISAAGSSLLLDAQPALHLALVLHELGTNARKHGALSTPIGNVDVNWEVRDEGGRVLHLTWIETGGGEVTVPSHHGFGTTLIEQSLKAHGGDAAIEYAQAGLCCVIKLPLTDLDQKILPVLGPRLAPIRPEKDQRGALAGKRVLIVEDEALICMVLADYLEEARCGVVGPAPTPEKALALIEQGGFDAALLDGNLAGRPVTEIAAALQRKSIPLVFVSGYGREALPQGFADVAIVEKPFTQDQVIGALEQLFTARQ